LLRWCFYLAKRLTPEPTETLQVPILAQAKEGVNDAMDRGSTNYRVLGSSLPVGIDHHGDSSFHQATAHGETIPEWG